MGIKSRDHEIWTVLILFLIFAPSSFVILSQLASGILLVIGSVLGLLALIFAGYLLFILRFLLFRFILSFFGWALLTVLLPTRALLILHETEMPDLGEIWLIGTIFSGTALALVISVSRVIKLLKNKSTKTPKENEPIERKSKNEAAGIDAILDSELEKLRAKAEHLRLIAIEDGYAQLLFDLKFKFIDRLTDDVIFPSKLSLRSEKQIQSDSTTKRFSYLLMYDEFEINLDFEQIDQTTPDSIPFRTGVLSLSTGGKIIVEIDLWFKFSEEYVATIDCWEIRNVRGFSMGPELKPVETLRNELDKFRAQSEAIRKRQQVETDREKKEQEILELKKKFGMDND